MSSGNNKAYGVSGGDVCFFYGAFALLLPAGLGSAECGVGGGWIEPMDCHTYGVGNGARLLLLFIYMRGSNGSLGLVGGCNRLCKI